MHHSGDRDDAATCDRYEDEFAAWDGLLQAHTAVARGLDADLRAAHGLPLSEFEVLLWLARRPCQQMRMAALAASALLSPSGVSRAVERLEARGLVRRERCREDRRGMLATLTGEGQALIAAAGATLAASIRTRMLDHLTLEERQGLAAVCQRLAATSEGAAQSCPGWDTKGR
ncbi:MAG: MarR family winged helix-turn-helix transcriptional regulator [Thermomicrobiales bacterium]